MVCMFHDTVVPFKSLTKALPGVVNDLTTVFTWVTALILARQRHRWTHPMPYAVGRQDGICFISRSQFQSRMLGTELVSSWCLHDQSKKLVPYGCFQLMLKSRLTRVLEIGFDVTSVKKVVSLMQLLCGVEKFQRYILHSVCFSF